MGTWKVDITGGANDAQWHGTVEADSGPLARDVALQAAHEEGFVAQKYTEVFVTHQS